MANNQPMILGATNSASNMTFLTVDLNTSGFRVLNSGTGSAMSAFSTGGRIAVRATRGPFDVSDPMGLICGVQGESQHDTGVSGVSESGVGVHGFSNYVGVKGQRGAEKSGLSASAAVWGDASGGAGVAGTSKSGVGVKAESQSGPALQVIGRAEFSVMGKGTFEPGIDEFQVAQPGVTSTSHISLMFVEPVTYGITKRTAGKGFVVKLTKPADSYLFFSYVVFEPISR